MSSGSSIALASVPGLFGLAKEGSFCFVGDSLLFAGIFVILRLLWLHRKAVAEEH